MRPRAVHLGSLGLVLETVAEALAAEITTVGVERWSCSTRTAGHG